MTTLVKEKNKTQIKPMTLNELFIAHNLLITSIKLALEKAAFHVIRDTEKEIPPLHVCGIRIIADVNKPYLEFDNAETNSPLEQGKILKIVIRVMNARKTSLFIKPTNPIKKNLLIQPVTHNSNLRKACESITSRLVTKQSYFYETIQETYYPLISKYIIEIDGFEFARFNTGADREKALGKLGRAEKNFINFLKSLETDTTKLKIEKNGVYLFTANKNVMYRANLLLTNEGFKIKIKNILSDFSITTDLGNNKLAYDFVN